MPTLTGIHNENEFYSHHYLAEIFAGDIQATLERWRKKAEAASSRTPHAELRALAPEHQRSRREFAHERRTGAARPRHTRRFCATHIRDPCEGTARGPVASSSSR